MTDLKGIIKKYNVDSTYTVVENGRQKFLCFTRLCEADDVWFIVASDGADVWRSEMDEDGLEAQRDLVGASSTDAFLTRIKNGFSSQEVSVARVGSRLTMNIGKGAAAMEFDLYEAKAADKKTEMQSILFRLAEDNSALETKLSVANQNLEKLRAQKTSSSGMNTLMDLGSKKGGTPTKAKPRKTGMSVVNPSSRKRKAAAGVVFD